MGQVYEPTWAIRVLDYEFLTCQYKVFESSEQAQRFGGEEETCYNRGLSREDAAWEGYYYKFLGAIPVDSIDGHRLMLK